MKEDDIKKDKEKEDSDNILYTKPFKIKHYKGKYMQIYNDEIYYLLDPHKYEISMLMGMLDIVKLNKLEGEFKKYNDGIEKEDFVRYFVYLNT